MADEPHSPLRLAMQPGMARVPSTTIPLTETEPLLAGDIATHGLAVSFNNAADAHYSGHDLIQQLALRVDFKDHGIVRDYCCASRDEVMQLLAEYASAEPGGKAMFFTMPKYDAMPEDPDRAGSDVDSDEDGMSLDSRNA